MKKSIASYFVKQNTELEKEDESAGPSLSKKQRFDSNNQANDVESGSGDAGDDESVRESSASANVGTACRQYKFNKEWIKTFPWLEYDQDRKEMTCKYCKKAGSQLAGATMFISGNPHCKRDAVVKHSESKRHLRCRDSFVNTTQPRASTMQSAVKKQINHQNEDACRQYKIKFNIAYFIAKEEIPFTKFCPLILLHKKNSVDINPTYDNDVRCAEMIGQIAEDIRETLAKEVTAARYLSVLIDGDADVSNTECEIVYVRVIQEGKPVNRLVGQQMLEHSHAAGTLGATKAAFDALGSDGDWMQKCVAFGADGASVNLGIHGGVIALLQKDAGKHVVPIHCMPHRLELAILNLQRKDPMVAKVYDLLHLVWKTYHFSPKSRRELKALGEQLGVHVCNPSSVKGTRWIPHIHRALSVFQRPAKDGNLAEDSGQYAVTHHHMDHLASSATNADIQGRAKKIIKDMKTVKFCAFSHFLADVFHELTTLSCTLQRNDLILPQAISELRKTVTALEAMQARPKRGGMLSKFLACLQHDDEVTFQGMALTGDVSGLREPGLGHHSLKQNISAVITIAVEALQSRFGSLLDDESESQAPACIAINSFKVFHHDAWPDAEDDLLDYGTEKVDALLRHFGEVLTRSGCQIEEVQGEWQGLNALVRHTFSDKCYRNLWQTLLTKEPYCDDYKNILHLVEIMLILPISAAQCERGFSAQNRIKNSTRSSLHVSTTEDLIRISKEGPSLESFDPSTCVWRSGCLQNVQGDHSTKAGPLKWSPLTSKLIVD